MNHVSRLFPIRSPWLPRALLALGLSSAALLAESVNPAPASRYQRVAILLSGDSAAGGAAKGHANATVQTTKVGAMGGATDSFSVHANKITFSDNTLSCEGAVRMESQGTVTEGEAMVIHLDTDHCQVFYLNPAGLKHSS